MRSLTLLSLVIFCLFGLGFGTELPSDFQRCTRATTEFDECLRMAIEEAIRKLATGNKYLHIPPLEPVYIQSATIKEGSGAVHVVQNYNNLKIHGIAQSRLTKVETNHHRNKFKIVVNATAPQYVLDADYDFNGHILVLPFVGSGKSKITLTNVDSDWAFDGEYVTRNGHLFLSIKGFEIALKPRKVSYVFDNLFNGDKVLSDQVHAVLNENWKDVFDDVKDGYEELIGTVFQTMANQLFSSIPIDHIFL